MAGSDTGPIFTTLILKSLFDQKPIMLMILLKLYFVLSGTNPGPSSLSDGGAVSIRIKKTLADRQKIPINGEEVECNAKVLNFFYKLKVLLIMNQIVSDHYATD